MRSIRPHSPRRLSIGVLLALVLGSLAFAPPAPAQVEQTRCDTTSGQVTKRNSRGGTCTTVVQGSSSSAAAVTSAVGDAIALVSGNNSGAYAATYNASGRARAEASGDWSTANAFTYGRASASAVSQGAPGTITHSEVYTNGVVAVSAVAESGGTVVVAFPTVATYAIARNGGTVVVRGSDPPQCTGDVVVYQKGVLVCRPGVAR